MVIRGGVAPRTDKVRRRRNPAQLPNGAEMKSTLSLLAATLAVSCMLGACSKEPDNAIDNAVENTKDALDMRDHEKLKDAGEEAKEAAKDAGAAAKDAAGDAADAVKDAADDVKDAAKDAQPKSN
jgi:gas vesicle protein